jgi:hypothetical protein
MRMRNRIALISLLVLSSGTIASGVNYIDGEGIRAPHSPSATTVQQRDHEPARIAPRSQAAPPGVRPGDVTETKREKKTLAILLLMLKDGRGAR